MKTEISIIMPVYNCEKYLDQAIESILDQSFNNFELIIINDNSTDRSDDIIKRYATIDKRIIYINNRYNKGLPGALNSGLEIANGNYIARADGDDINHKDRLKIEFNFLETHPEIDIVGSGYQTFGVGKKSKRFHPSSSIEIAWCFLVDTNFCHPTVMFRKKVLKTMPKYPELPCEDFSFFSEIIHKHQGFNINKILLNYRIHQTNYSNTNKKKIASSVRDTFLKNYKYFIGQEKKAEIYFKYKKEKEIDAKDLLSIINIEFKILKRIRRDYNKPIDYIFFLVIIKMITYPLIIYILNLIKK